MRVAVSRLILIGVMISAVAHADSPPEAVADVARLQGDWRVVEMKVNGLKHDQTEAESLFRTIEGDEFSVSRYSRAISRGTFKLDATQSPKAIDSLITSAPEPVTLLGIYEFDGEKLRICNAAPGKPRPKDFGCRLGSQQTLIVWERESQ